MKRLYLDYAATTPVDAAVLSAMEPYYAEVFGNPGSLHSFGQAASAAIFRSRQTIAQALNAHYSEIIFTGSATEANNLAIRGAVSYFQKKHPSIKPRIIISAIEHECVREATERAALSGVEVVIPVSKAGIVDIKKLKAALNERTVLVSIMTANNETGVIQPIAQIAKIVRDFRKESAYPLLHTDAVQAFQYLKCDVGELGVDMLTLSGHKIYGPKGIGALYVKNRSLGSRRPFQFSADKYLLSPVIVGGGQEEGMRSGTENVPLIIGFAKAVELAEKRRATEVKRVEALRNQLWQGVRKVWPSARLNGLMKNRLPNNLNIYFPKKKMEDILVPLDLTGIAVSSGAACAARSSEPSHVLLAMGQSKDVAKNSIRITLGRQTTKADIARLTRELARLR